MESPGLGVWAGMDSPLHYDGCCCLEGLGQVRILGSQSRACRFSYPAAVKRIMVQDFFRYAFDYTGANVSGSAKEPTKSFPVEKQNGALIIKLV